MVKKILTTAYLLLLAVIFSLPMIKSGLNYDFGIGFWGPNGHDGIWHLSLINHIDNPLNIPLPSYSGAPLQNYHPFFNIISASISNVLNINSSFVLFQIMPLLISFFTILIAFLIARRLFRRPPSWYLLPFLLVFSNSFGWLVTLIKDGSIGGESLFWAMQSPSIMFNPPLSLSLLFILILIYLVITPTTNLNYLFAFLLLTVLPITKAYSVPLAFTFWGLFSLHQLKSKNIKPMIILILSLLTTIPLYLNYNSLSSSLVEYKPFWFISSMFESLDRLYIPKIGSAIHNFSDSRQFFKLAILYSLTIPVFYIGNFGFRILGFTKPILKDNLHYYLLPSIIISLLIPLFFVQKGTPWNTIQFLYYSLFFSSILLVNYVDNQKNKLFRLALIIIILTVSLIPSTPTYLSYLTPTAASYISPDEKTALDFLSTQPHGLVLTYPYNAYAKQQLSQSTGLPLWAYETTSYVAAYARQYVFLEDEMNLENSGYDWRSRRQASLDFFKQQNEFQDRGFLVNNKVDYIYLTGNQLSSVSLDTTKMYLQPIFENTAVRIYKVQR